MTSLIIHQHPWQDQNLNSDNLSLMPISNTSLNGGGYRVVVITPTGFTNKTAVLVEITNTANGTRLLRFLLDTKSLPEEVHAYRMEFRDACATRIRIEEEALAILQKWQEKALGLEAALAS